MGFLDRFEGGGGGTRGIAHVTSCSQYQGRAVYSMCHMQLVVQG